MKKNKKSEEKDGMKRDESFMNQTQTIHEFFHGLKIKIKTKKKQKNILRVEFLLFHKKDKKIITYLSHSVKKQFTHKTAKLFFLS
jgi:hypothetical protein